MSTEKAHIVALAKEHRPNYVTEGVFHLDPERSTQYTRVKCDGNACDFYTQDKSWYVALDRHSEHVAEVIRLRLAQAWFEGHMFTGYAPGRGENPYGDVGFPPASTPEEGTR